MTTYILQRLLQAVALLFLLSIMFFLLIHYQPGGMCSGQPLGCVQAQHLDQPIANQYVYWLGHTVRGDFGISATGQPVSEILSQKLPATLLLFGMSIIIQQAIALPLGILAAVRQYSIFDQVLTFESYVALSIPAFVLGTICLFVLAVKIPWFPVGHAEDPALPLLLSADWWSALTGDPGLTLGDLGRHFALPVFVMVVTGIAVDSRFMRASMLHVLHQDYIRTAKAKGLKRRSVIFKHAFRNALLPILTNIALYLPTLMGTIVIVEQVFSFGGLGYAFAAAIGSGALNGGFGPATDYPFLETTLMLSAMLVLVANLVADVAYAWLDPRIRMDAQGRR